MNGADKDGDTNMDTDNPIILRKTKNSPTIICSQHKAAKVVPDEDAIIESNKLAFNDDIGTVTNRVTTMIERQANPNLTDEQYNELTDRIMCGQLYQQNVIDRAKGIIAKPMPEEWYNHRVNKIKPNDDEDIIKQKNFDMSIVADKKPYFMINIYPSLKNEYKQYYKKANFKCYSLFGKDLIELENSDDITEEEMNFLHYYYLLMPVGNNPCVVNRISWIFENEFNGYLKKINNSTNFDYNLLKSGTSYSMVNYNKIVELYNEYTMWLDRLHKRMMVERFDDIGTERRKLSDTFKTEAETICTNTEELCDIVLDICYTKECSKQFAWDICGEQILKNLLSKNDNDLQFPKLINNNGHDFKYMGFKFELIKVKVVNNE